MKHIISCWSNETNFPKRIPCCTAALLFHSLTLARFIFRCLFSTGFRALDDDRKHLECFFALLCCSFDEKKFFAFIFVLQFMFYFTWVSLFSHFRQSQKWSTTINSFRSQWFWHAHTNFKMKSCKTSSENVLFFWSKNHEKNVLWRLTSREKQ